MSNPVQGPAGDCCIPTCDDQVITQVPGPAGADGANGTDGTNGDNAFSLVVTDFVMPAELGTVEAEVDSSDWMTIGQIVFVQSAGYMEVTAKTDSTHVTLKNLEDTPNALYPDNVAPGTNVAAGNSISPSGIQGPIGGSLTGALLIVNDLSDVSSAANARSNLGLGSVATFTQGNADTNIPRVDEGGGLSNGEYLKATVNGIESVSMAQVKADLNLPSIVLGHWLVFAQQEANTTNAGTFTSGSLQTVPINTEVADTGNYGSIVGNTITLAAGTYRARWSVPAYQVDNFQTALYNVDLASVIAYGSNQDASAVDEFMCTSIGTCRFTLAIATQLQLKAKCETTKANTGFGHPCNFGFGEIYGSIEFEREGP